MLEMFSGAAELTSAFSRDLKSCVLAGNMIYSFASLRTARIENVYGPCMI